MSKLTIEIPPAIRSFELQESSTENQQPQATVPLGLLPQVQEVEVKTVPTMEQYLDTLARHAAVERYNSEIAMRKDANSEPVDHNSNHWYFTGFNATLFDEKLRNDFLVACEQHFAYLKNPTTIDS